MKRTVLLLAALLLLLCACGKSGDAEVVRCPADTEAAAAQGNTSAASTVPDAKIIPYSVTESITETSKPQTFPSDTSDATTTATAYTHSDDPEESMEFWFPAMRDARYCEDAGLVMAYHHMVQHPKFQNHTVMDFEEKLIDTGTETDSQWQVTLRTEVGDYTATFSATDWRFIKDSETESCFPALTKPQNMNNTLLYLAYYYMAARHPQLRGAFVNDFKIEDCGPDENGWGQFRVKLYTERGTYAVILLEDGRFIKDNQ